MSRNRNKMRSKSTTNPSNSTSQGTTTVHNEPLKQAKEMRPRISAPVAAAINEFSEKHEIPVTAVINLAVVEFLERNHRN